MRIMFICVPLLILCNFMQSQSEPLQVIGPETRLIAVAGQDLVLPCFIKPNTSAVGMTVKWWRLDLKDSLVHLYEDHEDRNEKQAESYRGRTSLFKEELQNGNASLKLSALRVSDQGEYTCLIEDKSWYNDITVDVIVEAKGSHPVIMMESYDNSGGINLMCESRGWNPEPHVLWLNREGTTLPAEDTQIHRDTDGFSMKRRITVYDYSDSNKFYCRFQQHHHLLEAEVIINSIFFGAWKWIVGISVSSCLIVISLIILVVIHYKKDMQRQSKEYEMQRQSMEYALMKKFTEMQRQSKEYVLPKTKSFEDLERLIVEYYLPLIKTFAVDVTLEPDTAHPNLIVSADGKQVTHGDTRQNVPVTPQRFTDDPCVLGKQSFSSGRFYYEVQVSGKTHWILGVARENINRSYIILRPQYGFWTVTLRNENHYLARADPSVPLTLREKVEKVGVFVDYKEGLVSFYDVKSSSHIYSFTGQCFTEKLCPFFSPMYNDRGINSAPLIISPVFYTE